MFSPFSLNITTSILGSMENNIPAGFNRYQLAFKIYFVHLALILSIFYFIINHCKNNGLLAIFLPRISKSING